MGSLPEFNGAPAWQARRMALSCCHCAAFAAALSAGRPYRDGPEVLAAIDAAFTALSWDDILEAMNAHPRIGDRTTGTSQAEQAGVTEEDRAAFATANQAYQERFGHVFLIRADGLTGQRMLAALRERLGNSAEAERDVARAELRAITWHRMRKLLSL